MPSLVCDEHQTETDLRNFKHATITLPRPTVQQSFFVAGFQPMKVFPIGRLLTLLALAGFLLAPIGAALAAPMMAMPMQTVTTMAADMNMNCCPKQQQPELPDCSKTCPFVAFCQTALGGVLILDQVAFNVRPLPGNLHEAGHSFKLASLAGEPPARPPRL